MSLRASDELPMCREFVDRPSSTEQEVAAAKSEIEAAIERIEIEMSS